MPMSEESGFIRADWPIANVLAGTTTRVGGVSQAPFSGFNLAQHVGDDPRAVQQNRAELCSKLALSAEPCWLEQVHGNIVVDAADCHGTPRADASFTTHKGVVCAVLTADCLPVLFASADGRAVAAAHAGWRGLAGGVLEATIDALCSQASCQADELYAWLGPAIGPAAFEVGEEVLEAFTSIDAQLQAAFTANRPGHWLADIYQLGRGLLNRHGVSQVFGGGLCTCSDDARFYSYRRAEKTGRMASIIMML